MDQFDNSGAMPPFGDAQNPGYLPSGAQYSDGRFSGSSYQAGNLAAGSASAAPVPPPLLLGTYTPKIDVKGRMALPAKFRSELGTGMVMARGQERCVYLLPQGEFRRIASQIQRTSMGNKAARDYLRVFLSGAVDQDPDKQGRVLVPQNLREYANLGSSVTVIGVGTRAEIWNTEAWQAYLADKEEGYADIADDVLPAMEW
jgi:MraZ protein